ncbi:tRNA pseudouridine synthase 1 [Cryptotrichosporon argae]
MSEPHAKRSASPDADELTTKRARVEAATAAAAVSDGAVSAAASVTADDAKEGANVVEEATINVSTSTDANAAQTIASADEPAQAEAGPAGAERERKRKGVGRDARGTEWRQRTPTGDAGEKKERLPKRKVAVLLGFCGTGYSGMQIQTHGSRTIEGDFFDALVKAGAISADNAVDHRKNDLQRAARTDAGVHAAGNCISLKMIIAPPLPEPYTTLTDYVNTLLPAQIRMWGFVRVMRSFQARQSCDSRVYEYLLPTYCLLPPSSADPLAKRLDETSPGWRVPLGAAAEFADAEPAPLEDGDVADPRARREYERRRGWRVDQASVDRFRALVKEYLGTHNFHNYTVGRPYTDRSVKRHMIEITVREPQVYGEIEWLSVKIHGQSFMLHQIRKMMSMAMLATRTGTPPRVIRESYNKQPIHVPKAPPLGLLLEAPQFATYNRKTRQQPKADEREYVDLAKYQKEMDAFKVEWIYDRLKKDELETHVFHKWIRQMDCTTSNVLAFLNTAGTIPPEASMQPAQDGGAAKQAAESDDESDVGDAKAEELEG